jgi:hypothetical protein
LDFWLENKPSGNPASVSTDYLSRKKFDCKTGNIVEAQPLKFVESCLCIRIESFSTEKINKPTD